VRTPVLIVGVRAVAALGVLLGVFTAAPPPVVAHTELAGSTPSPGATVSQLAEVRLQFRAPLGDGDRHAIRLLGPDGARWDDGSTRVVSDRTLVVSVAPELRERTEYTVRWCAVPADGHPQSGAYKFSYAGPTSATARPPAPAGDAGCAAAARGGAATIMGWLLVGIVAASMLLLAVMAVANRRRPAGQ
jgi:methionine-rich copper-binding protein CopC